MFACEKAVVLEPKNGNIRDSRGIARALTGDKKGAIEDFEAYIKSANESKEKAQRQRWIHALSTLKWCYVSMKKLIYNPEHVKPRLWQLNANYL